MAKAETKKILKLSWLKKDAKFYGLILTIAASTALLVWRLTTLTNSFINQNEQITKQQLMLNSHWWKSLNLLYGPYYLLLHLTYALNHTVFGFRITSVLIGVITVALVYWIVSSWHGFKIGLLAALISLTCFGLLAASREAIPLISQLLLVSSLLAVVSFINQKANQISLILFAIVFAFSLYVPGGVWFALVALWLSKKPLISAYKALSKVNKILIPLLPIVIILPLGYQMIRHFMQRQLNNWLGYGLSTTSLHTFWHGLSLNFIHVPTNLFIHSANTSTDLYLGHLPLVPLTFSVLFVLGLYSYLIRLNNWRWRNVVIFIACGWLIASFGVISLLALLPLVAVTAGTGLAFLLKEWYEIFPRNPIARFAGLFIMFAVVSLSAAYGIRSYFVAWANNPSVVSSYHEKLK